MTTRIHSTDKRAAAIADYHESGDTYAVVARRHNVSRATLHSWVNPKPKARGGDWELREEEVALTGGRWVNVRGVQRWVREVQPVRLTAWAIRQRAEEAMFTEDEARNAHRLYASGWRDERSVMGERVYQRRQKRAQKAQRRVAA